MSDASENAVQNKVVKEYIDGKKEDWIEEFIKEAKLAAHPIGSYFWSSEPTEPSELFGGTWERVEGKFILAASENYLAGATGGEAEHTLTVEEMPSHMHGLSQNYTYGEGTKSATAGYTEGEVSYNTAEAGGNEPHNNMPPYEVAYCWKRTA